MLRKHKRLYSIGFIVILFVSLFISGVSLKPTTVLATDTNQLCVPKHNDSTKVPEGGWFKASFRNRAVISVEYVASGECLTPKGADATYFFADIKMAPLISGEYVDVNTGDGNFEYVKQSGDNLDDEGRIDQFSGDLDNELGDAHRGQDKQISQARLKALIKDIEFVPAFEEDLAGKASCDTGKNDNFMLYDLPDDGDGIVWHCDSYVHADGTGFRVGGLVDNLEKFNITYRVLGKGENSQIQHVSIGEQKTRTFSWCPNKKKYISENCEGDLYFGATPEQIDALGDKTGPFELKSFSNGGSTVVVVAGSGNADGNITGDGKKSANALGNDAGEGNCEASGFNLSWIMCPVINGVAEAADAIVNLFIQPLLEINTKNFLDTESSLYQVWSSFRNIANVLLVAFLLVVVFGQAIGGGLVDAYTAKKVLPRVLAVAILINLSLYLFVFALDVTNIIGNGIYDLVLLPFKEAGSTTFRLSATTADLGFLAIPSMALIVVAFFSVSGGIGAIAPFILLFIVLPVFLAMLAVLVTLVIRRGLIVFLIISAPVALALYVLPNTEKYFRKWWDLFLRTLMVYPIIMIIFAISRVLGIATDLSPDSNLVDIVSDIIQVVLVVLPLFLIPFAFKIAGGALGSIYGTLNGIGKKTTEAIKGNPNDPMSLRNNAKRNLGIHARSAGVAPRQLGTRLNPRQLALGSAGRAARKRARDRISTEKEVGIADRRKQVEGSTLWQTTAGIDSGVAKQLAEFRNAGQARAAADTWRTQQRALPLGHDDRVGDDATIERKYDQRMKAISTAERIGWNPATRRAALMNPSYIKFETGLEKDGWDKSIGIMREIAGDDSFAFRSMMDEYQAVAKGPAGRTDQAGNVDGDVDYDLDKATAAQNPYELLNGHTNGVKGLLQAHVRRLQDPGATEEQKRKSAQFIYEMKEAATKNQGKAGARDAINANLASEDPSVNMAMVYNNYVNSLATATLATESPSAKQDVAEIEEFNPATGRVERRRVPTTVPITNAQESRDEARKRIDAQIGREARAYVPPDPNRLNEAP